MENKKIITINDVHNLVDLKNRDPNINPQELYRHVDRVQPNFGGEMWKWLWLPLFLSILSVIGMSFMPINGIWNRLSIILFIVSCLLGILFLKRYCKTWWWIPFLAVVILYVIYTETLSVKDLIKYITSLL